MEFSWKTTFHKAKIEVYYFVGSAVSSYIDKTEYDKTGGFHYVPIILLITDFIIFHLINTIMPIFGSLGQYFYNAFKACGLPKNDSNRLEFISNFDLFNFGKYIPKCFNSNSPQVTTHLFQFLRLVPWLELQRPLL